MLLKNTGFFKPTVSFDGQSSKSNFYGNRETEQQITKFDTKYFKNRTKILSLLTKQNATSISKSDITTLLESTQFQRERTLTFRDSEKGVRDFYEDFFIPQLEDLESYDSGHPPEVTEAIQKGMAHVMASLSDPKATQHFRLMRIRTSRNQVSDLKPLILKNKTNRPFIFSDSPVSYANPALRSYKCSKLANNSLGLQILYPLNSEFLVFFYDPEAYEIQHPRRGIILDITDENDINQINKLQIHEAFNAIYFTNPEDKNYVEKIWHQEKHRLQRKAKTVDLVNNLTPDGNSTGTKTYAISESEPTFYPDFRFLLIKDLSKSYIPYRTKYIPKADGVATKQLNDLIDRYPESPDANIEEP